MKQFHSGNIYIYRSPVKVLFTGYHIESIPLFPPFPFILLRKQTFPVKICLHASGKEFISIIFLSFSSLFSFY